MDPRALLGQQLGASYQIVKHSIRDLSDDDARRMPNAALSPILWQVGHLAVVDGSLARRASGASSGSLPGNFPDLFKTGTGGMAQYPPLDIVVQVFDGMHETLLRVVSETELDSPDASTRGLRTTRGEMLGFVNGHRWYHIGKIMSLRALLGNRVCSDSRRPMAEPE